MRQYAIKRIALIIPTVLLVSIIVFTVMRLLPGDPALVILSEGDATFTQEELADLREQLGTNRPIVVQYGIGFMDWCRATWALPSGGRDSPLPSWWANGSGVRWNWQCWQSSSRLSSRCRWE